MPRKKDEALHAERQQQILTAARKCFIANGFHSTSMRDILEKAGISAGGAYNYFAGKQDIIKALVAEEYSHLSTQTDKLQQAASPLEGMADMVFELIRNTSHEDAVLAGEIWAEASRNPEVNTLIQDSDQVFQSIIIKQIQLGMQQADISNKQSPQAIAQWLTALLEGYICRIASTADIDNQQAADIARHSVICLLKQS